MTVEMEVKFQLADHDVDVLQKFLNNCSISHCVRKEKLKLRTLYFDTQDWAFQALGWSLRVREVDGAFYQTLKGGGGVEAGLHQRDEWEASLTTDKPAFHVIPPQCKPQHMTEDSFNSDITLRFLTEFERSLWEWAHGDSLIEIALDRGHVRGEGRARPLCELELELKRGSKDVLLKFSNELQQRFALSFEIQSKAEKGYALLQA